MAKPLGARAGVLILFIYMQMQQLEDIGEHIGAGARVLVRVDANVPLKKGAVSDDTRLRRVLPTLEWLLGRGASLVVASHLGRPGGKPNLKYSLHPVANRLSELLGRGVHFEPNPLADKAHMPKNGVTMLQNVRFFEEEMLCDGQFSDRLATGCTAFVNDAFGTAHRAHASTVGVAKLLPSAAGRLMTREVQMLSEVRSGSKKPVVILASGAKMHGKIGVLEEFVRRAQVVMLGGGIANTFLAAKGVDVQDSLFDPTEVDHARAIAAAAQQADCQLMLPTDAVASAEVFSGASTRICPVDALEAGEKILDIGPQTQIAFAAQIARAGTFVWNGPVGIFELEPFAAGTMAMARAAAETEAQTILGGGDTLEAIAHAGLPEAAFTHLSTGGGAMLEFLEKGDLPALAALRSPQCIAQ